MFKKPPTIKPSTLLRSSNRRALIAQISSQFPAFAHAPPELVLQLVPETIRIGNAATSAEDKAVIYTDDNGRPLWFELGNTAGKGSEKAGKGKGQALVEVIPTVYVLWLLPTLLPRIPTEAKLLATPDSALMSGSSLMVPGLIPPPGTYPASSGPPPKKDTFIAITCVGSDVPLVVGRTEMDVEEMIERRGKGEKGKAIKVLHAYWDELWLMGGKGAPPGQDALPDVASLSVKDDAAPAGEAEAAPAAADAEAKEDFKGAEAAAPAAAETDASDLLADLLNDGDAGEEAGATASAELSTSEIDALLTLALLSAIAKGPPEELPVDASIFYSSHILPNRPTTWPPAPREEGAKASWRGVDAKRENIAVKPDDDVRKSSAKKLAKWIKTAEKEGLLKTKDVKGKVFITELLEQHADVKNFMPFLTMESVSEAAADAAADAADAAAAATESAAPADDGSGGVKLRTVVERFWAPTNQGVKLFQNAGFPVSTPSSRPDIRKMLEAYVLKNQLQDGRNKANVRLNDATLVQALFPKTAEKEVPATLARDAMVDKLLGTSSCAEHHRVSRLKPSKAVRAEAINAEKGGADEELEAGESRGPMRKGPPAPVRIEIKQRQGKKVVSLVTGLESFGVEPKELAAECKRKMGASASVSPLATSSPKNPLMELLIQGNQTKGLTELLVEWGIEKRLIKVEETKGKK